MSAHDDQWYRDKADRTLHREGELEFDDDAVVSAEGDGGAYVQCWAWVEDDPADAEVCDG